MRRLALTLIVPALLSCAEHGRPAGGSSGIEGRVVAFPGCPVITEASACPSKPVATTVVVESEAGSLRRVETGSDGTFRVAVGPGRYLVSAQPPPGSDLVPRPHRVTVEAADYLQVTVVLDTRLREP
jgi:hypothetical protein